MLRKFFAKIHENEEKIRFKTEILRNLKAQPKQLVSYKKKISVWQYGKGMLFPYNLVGTAYSVLLRFRECCSGNRSGAPDLFITILPPASLSCMPMVIHDLKVWKTDYVKQ